MKKQLFAIASIVALAGVVTFSSCKKDDITAPVITVTGGNAQSQSLPATAGAGTWTDPTATATDDEDGDVTVSVSGTVDPNLAGTYTLTYSATDAAGNTATETVTVTIVNDAAFLGGSYAADDTCQVSVVLPYTSDWTASSTVNNAIIINDFGGFGNSININATRSGNTLSIATPQTLGATASLTTANATFTNPSGNTVTATIVYQWTDGSSNEVCTSTYSK